MAPSTWTALAVLVVAVLPGAMFTFGFERQAGAFGVTAADRVLRFVAVSLCLDLAYAWPAYLLYRSGLAPPPWHAAQFAVTWAGAVAALTFPFAAGSAVAGLYTTRNSRAGWPWLRRVLSSDREERVLDAVLGRDPAPRAWDFYFSERPVTYLRVRTRDGTWVGGLFARGSSAGGFPHGGDLLIEEEWPLDEAGTFGDEPLGYALYVPADSISFLEMIDLVPREEARHG